VALVSDTGKRWYKVTGLADGPAYTFQRSETDARCEVGNGYLGAEPIAQAEAEAYFLNLASPQPEEDGAP